MRHLYNTENTEYLKLLGSEICRFDYPVAREAEEDDGAADHAEYRPVTLETDQVDEALDDEEAGEADDVEDAREDENDAGDEADEEDVYEARDAQRVYHAQRASCPQEVACSCEL